MSARSLTLRTVAVAAVVVFAAVLAWLGVAAGDDPPSSADSTDETVAPAGDDSAPTGTGGGRESAERSEQRRPGNADSERDEAQDLRPRLHERASTFLEESGRVLGSGGDADALADTATGPALDAARASAAEFADNGWHQVGQAELTSSKVVFYRPDASPPRMRIAACVDSSDVDVVDDAGDSVRHGSYAARSMMLFDLVREHGDWLVQRQSFPDDPDCRR